MRDRLIPAFQPTYVAGFIQDKFAFDDLIFNVGLRVDRYDANQQVLKDRYLLHDAYTVGEATGFSHPASVENDYVVYVDDFTNPTKITGYRSDNIWFDATGNEVDDPSIITQESDGNVTPYLKDDTPERGGALQSIQRLRARNDFYASYLFLFPYFGRRTIFRTL